LDWKKDNLRLVASSKAAYIGWRINFFRHSRRLLIFYVSKKRLQIHMKNRYPYFFGITLLTFVGTIASGNAQDIERPNIVLILADDLGYTDISPFGSQISTPNIARLANQGLSFTNYHTAGSCAPA
jgi:hypothetical protein